MRIKVKTDQGEIEVQAKIYYSGSRLQTLAVHRAPGYEAGDPDVWTLTHIQSGWAVKTNISHADAVSLAETLKDADWNYRETKVPGETRQKVAAALLKLGLLSSHEKVIPAGAPGAGRRRKL